MAKAFISYQNKGGADYATVHIPQRVNGEKRNAQTYLGLVVDKERGIFKNHERGVFCYTLNEGFQSPPNDVLETQEESLILDFGDAYALSRIAAALGLNGLIHDIFGNDADTMAALLMHRILTNGAFSHAADWLDGSYARMLFPGANLKSQRISEFLTRVGDERVQREFFKKYLALLNPENKHHGILVDSTALPNDINFALSAPHSEGGLAENETRLLFVVDRATGFPLYFRYNAGNIVDVSTLVSTIDELRANGVNTDFAIVDAGYYSEGNIRKLYDSQIAFLTRLKPNLTLYKTLLADHAVSIETPENAVIFNGRVLYIERVEVNLFGKTAYAFIAIDIERKSQETRRYLLNAVPDKTPPDEIKSALKSKGLFILITTEKVETSDILGLYYSRQQVEQIFDICKTNLQLLPLRTHSEPTFRGHLLVSFLVAALYLKIQQTLRDTSLNAIDALVVMHNLKCKIFDNTALIKEPTAKMKSIATALSFDIPSRLCCG